MQGSPTFREIQDAAERISPFVHRTPVMSSSALNRMVGADLFFKCENLQKVGAFKIRGAINAVHSLSEQEISNGVATHSSGNHAAAVALAASTRGVPVNVVMPHTAPTVKKDAVAGYGANIVFCEPTLADRGRVLTELTRKTGAYFIHPYDNRQVIAGQGTVALEFIEQTPDLDVIVTPVGGGGLIGGTALTVAAVSRATKVIGVEPAGADDAYQSLRKGERIKLDSPVSIADGLLASLSERTYGIIAEHVDDIVRVDENTIIRAMRVVWERMKLVIEPSAAVALAALLSGQVEVGGRRVGIILSGGNVDLENVPWAVRR